MEVNRRVAGVVPMNLSKKTEHELWVLLDEIKKELATRDEE
tara:strand:+ start:4001 stop:4123 length:123 start_codon:yes stop_codon:yes gene_type:complete